MFNCIKRVTFWSQTFLLCLLMNACTTHHEHSALPEVVSELKQFNRHYDLCKETETLIYDIVSVDETGATLPYGTMELQTRKEGDMLWMNDTITLKPQYAGMIFARTLSYKENDLLHPLSVTLDISAESKTTREMSYSDGIFSVHGQDPVKEDFSEGILTYNAMLRVVRMLGTNKPHRYTFSMYAEPFLFRVHESEENEKFCLEVVPETDSSLCAMDITHCVLFQVKNHETKIYLDKNRKPVKMTETFQEGKMVVFELRQ